MNMSRPRKISELPEIDKPLNDEIDEKIFYVEKNEPDFPKKISLKKVFEYLKERAISDGELEVKLYRDKIFFLSKK